MDALFDAFIDFQFALVSSLLHVAALGVALIGLGMILSTSAPTFGYRVKRLGLQTVGASMVVIGAHYILLEIYGPNIPPTLLVAFYAVVGILLLQSLLNLLFGPSVGRSVISTLLTSLVLVLVFAALQPFPMVRDLFQ